jgi:hypothetical protein
MAVQPVMEAHPATVEERSADLVLRAAADVLSALSVLEEDPADIAACLPFLRDLRSDLPSEADLAIRERAVEQLVSRLAVGGRLDRWQRILVAGVVKALDLPLIDSDRAWMRRYTAAAARAGSLRSLDWPGESAKLRRPWESLHWASGAQRADTADAGTLFVTSQRVLFVDASGMTEIAYAALLDVCGEGVFGMAIAADGGQVVHLVIDEPDLAEAHLRAAWDSARGIDRPQSDVPAMPPADDALEALFRDASSRLDWTLQDVNTARLMWHATAFEPELLRSQLG